MTLPPPDPSDDPATLGLLRCLQMLAEEASALHLSRTLVALQQAMEACRLDAAMAERPPGSEPH